MPFILSYLLAVALCFILYRRMSSSEVGTSWFLKTDNDRKWFVATWFIPTVNFLVAAAMGIILLVNHKEFMDRIFKR
jgi:hypothetical protein